MNGVVNSHQFCQQLGDYEYYMSQGYFESDYFNVEADPNLSLILQSHSQRKPSCDQLLNDLFPSEEVQETVEHSSEPSASKSIKSQNQSKAQKKPRKKRQSSKITPEGVQRGHWCIEQKKRYHWFLQIHSNHFLNKHMRRTDRIFKTMETFMITREAEQCRSHHQKMQKKYGNYLTILKELRMLNYGTGDAQVVLTDMHLNGVDCSQKLIDQCLLVYGNMEKNEEIESEKSTINECSPSLQNFVDPLLQMQRQDKHLWQQFLL